MSSSSRIAGTDASRLRPWMPSATFEHEIDLRRGDDRRQFRRRFEVNDLVAVRGDAFADRLDRAPGSYSASLSSSVAVFGTMRLRL